MGLTLLNRFGNPIVRAILRSPLHRLLSGRLLLITYTGRRTGAQHTLPVGYREDADSIRIGVGAPVEKVWWRNLREPAPVDLLIRGERLSGVGRAVVGESGLVEVTVQGRAGVSA